MSRVVRTRDLYEGEHLDALPDLLVEWNEAIANGSTALGSGAGARVSARSQKIGTIESERMTTDAVASIGRAGGSWPAGPGSSKVASSATLSLLDLAPTFTRILGVELPGAEGAPIAEIVA